MTAQGHPYTYSDMILGWGQNPGVLWYFTCFQVVGLRGTVQALDGVVAWVFRLLLILGTGR
jgi:hypothetical protein